MLTRLVFGCILVILGACGGAPALTTHTSPSHRASAQVCSMHHGPVFPPYHPWCTTDSDCQDNNARCVNDGNTFVCSDPVCTSDADCGEGLTRCVQNGNFKTCSEIVDCEQDSDCILQSMGCMEDANRRVCIVDSCLTDDDCGPHGVCACSQMSMWTATPINNCVYGNCRTDADCPLGVSCSPSPNELGYQTTGFYCHTTRDACNTIDDCPAPQRGDHEVCLYVSARQSWDCLSTSAIE